MKEYFWQKNYKTHEAISKVHCLAIQTLLRRTRNVHLCDRKKLYDMCPGDPSGERAATECKYTVDNGSSIQHIVVDGKIYSCSNRKSNEWNNANIVDNFRKYILFLFNFANYRSSISNVNMKCTTWWVLLLLPLFCIKIANLHFLQGVFWCICAKLISSVNKNDLFCFSLSIPLFPWRLAGCDCFISFIAYLRRLILNSVVWESHAISVNNELL